MVAMVVMAVVHQQMMRIVIGFTMVTAVLVVLVAVVPVLA